MGKALIWTMVFVIVTAMIPFSPALAEPVATTDFSRVWARTDQPVANQQVNRTWMWGPEPFTPALQEDYSDAPGKLRNVQYFDKSRMEENSYRATAPWDVTNGLLARELMTGRMQLGDSELAVRAAAEVNVAGDANDPNGPTYAAFGLVMSSPPVPKGTTLIQTIDRIGIVEDQAELASYGVTAAYYVPETDHTVASVFWSFMNSGGLVSEGGKVSEAPLFENPFYATGFPTTEAYWAVVKVAGTPRWVLTQAFERRVLTYTPDNPAGWQVEAGNVGQHYYHWRYGPMEVDPGPSVLANDLIKQVKKAPNDEARYQALLAVLEQLNVGVYTGSGQQVLAGGERGPNDFYLYDFQVRLLSAALGRGQMWDLDAVVGLLSYALIPEGQPALDPEFVRQGLLLGTANARAKAQEPERLAALLVRQLGLYQPEPYDMFESVPHEAQFDALQLLLILADTLVPVLQSNEPLAASQSNLMELTEGILQPATLSGTCDPSSFNSPRKGKWKFRTYSEQIATGTGSQTGTRTQFIIDTVHASTLAFTIEVGQSESEEWYTHYGPPGHTHMPAGRELSASIYYYVHDNMPKELASCGALAAYQWPKQGPLAGVNIQWSGTDWLRKHGTIICGTSCTMTGADGVATLKFRPKNESGPGEGEIKMESGYLRPQGTVRIAHSSGGFIPWSTSSVSIRWGVSWHESPGWNISIDNQWDVTYVGKTDQTVAKEDRDWGQAIFTLALTEQDLAYMREYGSWIVDVAASASMHTNEWHLVADNPETCSWSWTNTVNTWAEVALVSDSPPVVQVRYIDMPETVKSGMDGLCDLMDWTPYDPVHADAPFVFPLDPSGSVNGSQPPPTNAPHHGAYYNGSGWEWTITVD